MSTSYKELQRDCKLAGLPARGTRAELVKRLELWKRDTQNRASAIEDRAAASASAIEDPAAANASANEDNEPENASGDEDKTACDALLVTNATLRTQEVPEEVARDSLDFALRNDELYIDEERGNIFVANQEGSTYARLAPESERLDEVTNSLREKITELELGNLSREKHLHLLTDSLKAHSNLRNRFISTYNRDILNRPTKMDHKFILEGNADAHGGDAVADSMLYDASGADGRDDFKSFESLYGVHPGIVKRLRLPETINLLNLHATAISSKRQPCDKHFFELFEEFVRKFADGGRGYKEDYLQGDATEVTRAYWACFVCYNRGAGGHGSCH